MITLVSFLTVLTLSLAGDLSSGDWGILYLLKRHSKCYGYDLVRNQLYSRNCNKLDALQIWRYDADTHQLQNKGITQMHGDQPYCAVLSEIGDHKPIRMGPCLHSGYNKFLARTQGGSGTQSFIISLDSKRCIDVSGWTDSKDQKIQTARCEDESRSNTDHWTIFSSVGRYTGPALPSLPKQKSFRDGDWGSLSVSPAHDSCYGIEGHSGMLQQQTCNNLDKGQKWKYDVASMTISNYRYPLGASAGKGCLTVEGHRFYERHCYGGSNQKFILNDGTRPDGTYQRIQLFSNVKKCLDVDGWNTRGVRKIHQWNCQRIDEKNSDHWLMFNYWKAGVSCAGGSYRLNGVCKTCPRNTFSAQGSSSCTPCPSGTISEAGSTSCTTANNCKAGTYLNGNSCTSCPINTYSDQDAASSCKNCPAGYYTNGAGSKTCLKKPTCLAGQFVNNGVCVNCPRNTYSDTMNAATCTSCPSGYETKGTGSTTCTLI